MSKTFTKNILSSIVVGLVLAGGTLANAKEYEVTIYGNGAAEIKGKDDNRTVLAAINVNTGSVMSFNNDEFRKGVGKILKEENIKDGRLTENATNKIQDYLNKIAYPVYFSSLKLENIKNIDSEEVERISKVKDEISKVVTSSTARTYLSAVRNGGNTEAYLTLAKQPELANEYSRITTNIEELNKNTTFAIDDDGNITLDESTSTGERYSVKNVVADLVEDTTVYAENDGSLTLDRFAPTTKRANEALVDLDKSIKDRTTIGINSDGAYTGADGATTTIGVTEGLVKLSGRTDKLDAALGATDAKVESRTTVGVNSDGTLTRAEGAATTIAVNDGLVQLSGRTDRIDATVGAIDGRVTRNTQSIEKNSKAIAANTRTLQQHSARLDSQQRQINENHKEMKRAAAQSAALTGLFQPYSVGKFNATAAVGGYSDQQALAVGVGYRFNEQTAAKAGVAFSDGDASWNVGVNFEF
ncbi:YadA-like family protein [Escherichia coli]|nr:YadA-like family protein [Escherichia coli]